MADDDDMQGAAGVPLSHIIEAEENDAEDTSRRRRGIREMVDGGAEDGRQEANYSWDFPVPPIARKYLKSDEAQAIPMRQHVIRLALPAVVFVGGLLAAIALDSWAYATGHAKPNLVHLIWWAWFLAAGWSLVRYMLWRQTWFVVTGHRVMLIETSAKLRRTVTMLPISKMRDYEFTQTLLGRWAGYATFEFMSIGTDRALRTVRFVPYPVWVYQQISELVMPADDRRPVKPNRESESQ
jgi:Bacterial PH domain